MGESRLDLHPRLKLELSRCRSLLSLSIPLGPGLSIVKLKELSLHIPTDGIWAEPNQGTRQVVSIPGVGPDADSAALN